MFRSYGAREVVSEYYGPRGFHWLEPGLLGGCAQPGVVGDPGADLAALERVGTRVLVTLTEEWEPDAHLMRNYGIVSLYFPIPDREAADTASTEDLCEKVDGYLRDGEAVVFHCRAGKGRTGTLLASQLIWAGMSAPEAVELVRSKNRNWIESSAQMEFLTRFAAERGAKMPRPVRL